MLLGFFGIFFLTRIVSNIMQKKNSDVFSVNGITGSLFYVCETSLFALFYFWAFNGFKLYFTLTVILYGLVYGLVVIGSLISSVFVYKYASFGFVSFVLGSASLILALVSGNLFFGEQITVDKIVRVLLMLVATFVIFIGNTKKTKSEAQSGTPLEKWRNLTIACALILALALLGTCSTALLKAYSGDSRVTDQNSFFFMTNIFSAILVLPVLPFTMKRDKVYAKDLLMMVKSKKTVYSLITTLSSNISSIVQAALLGMMDMSIFSPISSALGFAVIAVVTPIIGERIDRYTIISTIIAILSIVVPTLLF